MISSSKALNLVLIQVTIGFVIGAVIACSPTKFNSTAEVDGSCQDSTQNCVYTNGYKNYNVPFKVGAGKVDILFVDDNSASMSFEQKIMSSSFGGFVEQLDRKGIDYRIAVTTTDLNSVRANKLIKIADNKYFITNSDANRVGLFNQAIVRTETVECESFILGIINSFGAGWRSSSLYQDQYFKKCASPDERGIYTPSLVLSENASGFVRSDANLNIIVISDEDVRSGTEPLEDPDKYQTFISNMSSQYSSKYWEFNSIIVKDNACLNAQSRQILDQQGQSAVGASIGFQYSNLSNSPALDIDGNPRPRGRTFDICQNSFTPHFNTIATQILDSARLLPLNCKPEEAPIVTSADGRSINIPYTWDGDRKIVFNRGSEGIAVNVKYRCYAGVK